MDKKNPFLSVADFLNDDTFIAWRLFQTEELNTYWADFVKENPLSEALLREAVQQFEAVKLNEIPLPLQAEEKLYEKIRQSINAHRQRKKQRIVYWVSAAASFLLLIASVTFFTISKKTNTQIVKNEIIGETLPSENVRLISGADVIDLQSHSAITLSSNGHASVTDSSRNTKALQLAENKNNKLIVPYGKRSFIALSDGTKVWINSGSEMDFPSNFTSKSRDIYVKGEVYLEVAKSALPFVVHTHNANIRVLGTKFNIAAYHDDATESVVLVEGSVQVNTASKAHVMLKPNEMATISTGSISKQTVDASEYIAWHNGVLEFDETSMTEVLKKIGRYYNVSFENMPDVALNKKTVSGKLFLSNNLDSVMSSISRLSSTQYTRNNNHIIIRKK